MKINAFNLGMPYYGVLKKLVLIMKMIIIIMTICLVQVSAAGLAQKVTLNEKETPLQNIIQKIRLQTGYDFIIDAKLLDKAKKVTINVNNAGLEDALDAIFKNQQLSYSITDKVVAIEPKEPSFLERLAERWADRDVRGRILDESGSPLEGATIVLKGAGRTAKTDAKGEFVIPNVPDDAVLVIRYVGYKPLEIPIKGTTMPLEIKLNQITGQLEEVAVKGNTGYQVIDKNHPGSFDVIDNNLLNRSVSKDILTRIQNLTTGISFGNTTGGGNGILIRGRNSIFSNVNPLIVVDNFPYDGDINNINPNDIENVTILKDAASAAQWGAKAGNGVIVITTKKGKTERPTVSINSNLVYQNKPNLQKLPIISSSDAVEVERWLFDKGYYNSVLNNRTTYPILSPVQETLLKKRNGQISTTEADQKLEQFKAINARTDLEKYFYQPQIAQQYALNVSGNSSKINYYLSGGLDKQQNSLVGSSTNRINLTSRNTFKVTKNLSIEAGLLYTQANSKIGGNPGTNISLTTKSLYPYADLVDHNENALPIVKGFRNSYIDTAGNGKLLDWKYRPYDEIKASQTINRGRDFLINTAIQYKLLNALQIEARYQFQNFIALTESITSQEAYGIRDLINRYYQPNADNKYPIPLGSNLSKTNSEQISHQGRVQVSYQKKWGETHNLSGFIGWEIKEQKSSFFGTQTYGYQKEGNAINPPQDFVTEFPQYYFPAIKLKVPFSSPILSSTLNRSISYYLNTLYTFKDRYSISGSIRKDQANIFGANTNQKGVPLWSAGLNWEIGKESFYSLSWLAQLRLRASYGHSGNFSTNVSALSTIQINSENNLFGVPYARIIDFPNKNLRWEQNRIFNVGLDFGATNGRISGTFEFYKKHNVDLLAQGSIDPSTGLTPSAGGQAFFYGNIASTKGNGYELRINSLNINKGIKWNTTFQFTNVLVKVSEYFMPPPTQTADYVREGIITPIVGQPIYTVYTYKWAGLEATTGDPMGYLDGQRSKNYNAILNNTPVDSLVYKGNVEAPTFGALLNRFSYKNFSLSTNITYRFKYNIRKSVLSYSSLYSTWTGHSDYAKRWQNAGDEERTNVPSQVYTNYPGFSYRDNFYQNSEIPIYKGDHIKINDISVDYVLTGRQKRLPFEQLRIYGNISNLNIILWRAAKGEIDPTAPNGRINKPNFAFGLSANF